MAARAKKVADLDQLEPRLREQLVQQGLLRATELTRAGVPRAQHAEAIARLRAAGFEALKSGVRVPLRRQIEKLLGERQLIPLAQLSRALKGTTQKEARAEAENAVREGAARIAIRGKIEVLAALPVKTLSREQLSALANAGALGARALRKPPRTLLLDDVREQLFDLVGPQQQALDADLLVSELTRHVRPAVGLSFVPDAVRALAAHGIAAVQTALIDAARAGRIELQPESGLNRLSQAELELCPPGPQGTRLSWARLLERADG
ncbi:MAG TPA: hypothetical protein VI356_24960 [Myxococcales bacterium]